MQNLKQKTKTNAGDHIVFAAVSPKVVGLLRWLPQWHPLLFYTTVLPYILTLLRSLLHDMMEGSSRATFALTS